ncbi:PEP/pyruvate-binding domain-containing protein [Thermodesulfobacteriota bacterium]
MSLAVGIEDLSRSNKSKVGEKAFTLGVLHAEGFAVPRAVCVTTDAYDRFVQETGLKNRIFMELSRKPLDSMRWEEMWDCALRIRNMFLTAQIPGYLSDELGSVLERLQLKTSVAVRSTAPGEDSSSASFAGIHESYVNITGIQEVIDHIKLVWASLWSDRALLYRRELNLDYAESSMAVLIQEMITGEKSGIAFGKSPTNPAHCVIEAVYGLNQGLVDGTIEPDRWILDRETGQVVSHTPAHRERALRPGISGVRTERLPMDQAAQPPLTYDQVSEVYGLSMQLEGLFSAPQDSEWTFKDNELVLLQSRPITVEPYPEEPDDRKWYLSLRRSFENLQSLRERIEQELLPQMDEEADQLCHVELSAMSDRELVEEVRQRQRIHQKWTTVYWDEFIPMAHGIRLFGQVYNDIMRPEDPYEFLRLLTSSGMLSVERNRKLMETASQISDSGQLEAYLSDPLTNLSSVFADMSDDRGSMVQLLQKLQEISPDSVIEKGESAKALEEIFLAQFKGDKHEEAAAILDLARASYRLRDDDNLYIGRIDGEFRRAIRETQSRVKRLEHDKGSPGVLEKLSAILAELSPDKAPIESKDEPGAFQTRPRQLVGQPAGPGVAVGRARVIKSSNDLFDFQAGEVLVCDAVDPNITFVVPLCAGIVERRGGMLIHGAIIAREYGLPCVTGVPEAASSIITGDSVTVDGYLGIVTVDSQSTI